MTRASSEIRRDFGVFLERFDAEAPQRLDQRHLEDLGLILITFTSDMLAALDAEGAGMPAEHFDDLAASIETLQDMAADRASEHAAALPASPAYFDSTQPEPEK